MSEQLIRGIAFSALSDPASLAVAAENDIARAEKFLSFQLKMHLLTSEHLMLSKGFLFDNPAIWRLLQRDGFARVLTAKRAGSRGVSTLLIQADEEDGKGAQFDDIDSMFRLWAFGRDHDRILRPSATRILGSDLRRKPDFLQQMNRVDATLDQYASELGSSDLQVALETIQNLFTNCERSFEPSDRYERFTAGVRAFVEYVSSEREGSHTRNFQHLYADIGQVRKLLDSRARVSRSDFEAADYNLWWRWAPHLNHIRLTAHYPRHLGSGNISFLPDVANRMIGLEDIKQDAPPKWTVALAKLSFSDILELRGQPEFRSVLEKLARAAEVDDQFGSEHYYQLLKDEWSPALLQGVREVAGYDALERPISIPDWIAPTAGSVATTIGYLTTVHSHLNAQSLETSAIIAIATHAAQLIARGGLRISRHFHTDSPEGRAHLLSHRLLDDVRRLKPEDEEMVSLRLAPSNKEKLKKTLGQLMSAHIVATSL